MGGRGTKRMLQDNAQHHNMAVDDPARTSPVDEVEGNNNSNAQDDPYMTFHDAQGVGRGSAFPKHLVSEAGAGVTMENGSWT